MIHPAAPYASSSPRPRVAARPANDPSNRQVYTAYQLEQQQQQQRHPTINSTTPPPAPAPAPAPHTPFDSGHRAPHRPSPLANNYHAKAGHQPFSALGPRDYGDYSDYVEDDDGYAYDYRAQNDDDDDDDDALHTATTSTSSSSKDQSPLLPSFTPPATPPVRGRFPTSQQQRHPHHHHHHHAASVPAAMGPTTRTYTADPAGFSSPYGMPPTDAAGEDKLAEKMAANGADGLYGRAGMAPVALPPTSKGRYASMLPEQAPPQNPLERLVRLLDNENFCLGMYTLLALFTRLYRIGRSGTVIWDEAHFGKFGSHYLKHEFYFDVHPPLGKMLVGLAGALSGYNGSFEFKSGEKYPEGAQYYVGMRIILALFGVAMVPLAWSSSGALGWNKRSRHLLATMVLCDNAWLVISRFILLDSMLLCFTFTTVHGLLMFHQQQHRPFGEKWWFWLAFTGFSIGCVASVKWVGLFVMALVGLYTLEDLWDKFGDLKMPVRTYARHWCARALCLMAIPGAVYLAAFKIHFMILSRSGPGDAQMSSLFQAHLRGNDFARSPLEAAFGSKVTFKNMGYGGGLLHSHVQTYPGGSQQQQVTCYHYKDNNNEFVITPKWGEPALPKADEEGNYPADAPDPRMLKNGDVLRLVHASTSRNLHSHKVAAPVTKENYEVSGYGNGTIGDSNDYWVVEIVDDMHLGRRAKPGQVVRSLTTRMRFRHQNLGCYLRAANAVLPQWGWKQVEVSCDKENNPKDDHTYWNIESHWNDRLPAGDTKLYRSPFLRDFIHLNVAMMTSNNALIPDADKDDILASKPYDWPFLWNGLRMNSWADQSTKYYLIGNPVIWWGSSVAILVFLLTLLYYLARMQRRHADLTPAQFNQFVFVGKVGFLGWFLHYLPFMVMARVCYIHHYLPTLYFATILYVHVLDHFLFSDATARYRFLAPSRHVAAEKGVAARGAAAAAPISDRAKNVLFVLCLAAIVGTFAYFHKTALGIDGPVWQYRGRKWRKSWNIYD